MEAWNKSIHDSYTCFLKNVVKFLFAGKTNFSSIFKYGAVPSPPYGHNVDSNKSACLFSNMNSWNKHLHDSNTCFLKNVVKFSFAGQTIFSSVFQHDKALSRRHFMDTIQFKVRCFAPFNTKDRNKFRLHSYTFFENRCKIL